MRKLFAVSLCVLSVSTHAAIINGAIVGRDMDDPVLKKAGHIGLAYTPNNPPGVIEVLSGYDHESIRFSSLEDFKKKTRYWGAKYSDGFERCGREAATWANGQSLYCADYTYTTLSRPYNYNSKACGQWRCDTFVQYAYATVSCPITGVYTTPINIWNALPYIVNENSLLTAKMSTEFTTSLADDSLNMLTIANKSFDELDITELDALFAHDFTNKKIGIESNTNSVESWWIKYLLSTDKIHKSYALDILAEYGGADYLNKFINAYENEVNEKNKKHLARVIDNLQLKELNEEQKAAREGFMNLYMEKKDGPVI